MGSLGIYSDYSLKKNLFYCVSNHPILDSYLVFKGAWLSERLRRWSNKPDIVGSIPVTTEFFLISCDSNQVPKWFGTHNNLEVSL